MKKGGETKNSPVWSIPLGTSTAPTCKQVQHTQRRHTDNNDHSLQKDSKEVPHNLGARLAPGGNKNNEQAHLIHKGRTISQNISTSKLHKNEVMMAYRVMLRPAINYPLCGSTFSADEGNSINRSYLPTLLTRMDFNSKTKSVFWFFWPPSLRCFGFTNTYMDQGISQVNILVSHLRNRDEIGKLIKVFTEKLRLIIGL